MDDTLLHAAAALEPASLAWTPSISRERRCCSQAHADSVEELRREIDHALVVQALERALRRERLRHDQQLELIRTLGRHAERMAIRVAAAAELATTVATTC